MFGIVDGVVAIYALYWWSQLSNAELVALNIIESETDSPDLWLYSLVLMSAIFLCVWLHLNRHRARDDFQEMTGRDEKISMVWCCDVCTLAILVVLLMDYIPLLIVSGSERFDFVRAFFHTEL